jgi:hypothetical protein
VIPLALWLGMLAARSALVSAPSDFATTVRPILERRCQPCHFPGGRMYERLPFDRPETIVKLNTKLFTRIKDEQERTVIRKFLAKRGAGSRGVTPTKSSRRNE